MKEQLVSFETAKLAKEKGFDWEVFITHYGNNGVFVSQTMGTKVYHKNSDGDVYCTAPTQSLLQKWLRDKHLIVEIKFDTVTFGFRIFNPFKAKDNFTKYKYVMWEYEQALEEGLQEALKLVKK